MLSWPAIFDLLRVPSNSQSENRRRIEHLVHLLNISFDEAKHVYRQQDDDPVNLAVFPLQKQLDEFCREFDAFILFKRQSDQSFTPNTWLHTFIQEAGATRFSLLMSGQADQVLKQLRSERTLQVGRILIDPSVVSFG